ncbi:MAG: type III-A CRISPR-associated protein Csm2 [Syntrophomonadales bacterium]|jgi:CRISPR-associated protein Csm2
MSNGEKKTLKDLKNLGEAMGMKPWNNLGPEPEYFLEDADYVSIAEKRMTQLMDTGTNNPFGNLTTSKIRNILTIVNDIHSEVINNQDEVLSQGIVDRIRHVKVRLAYEAGRERDSGEKVKKIKKFIETAELIKGIDHIGQSRTRFLRYFNYLEALVAYHRFLGGKDK